MEQSSLPPGLWGEVLRCHGKFGKSFEERICLLYSKQSETQIPLDVRSTFAWHFEKEDWANITDEAAADHFDDLKQLLLEKMETSSCELVDKLKWKGHYDHINDTFADSPRYYADQIHKGMQRERTLIDSCYSQDEVLKHGNETIADVKEPDDIKLLLNEVYSYLERFKSNVENTNTWAINLLLGQELLENAKEIENAIPNHQNTQEKERMRITADEKKRKYKKLQDDFVQGKNESEGTLKFLCMRIKTLFEKLINATQDYRQGYKLSTTGLKACPDGFLDTLNRLCTQAYELFLKSVNEIDSLLEIYKSLTNNQEVMKISLEFRNQLFSSFEECLQNTVVVTMGTQILKVTTERSPQFRADLKILGGSKLGFETGASSKVTANVYKTEAVDKIRQGKDVKPFCALANGEKSIQVVNLDCIAKFDKLKLEKVRDRNQALRASREELVCEQQYQIVFTLNVPIKGVNIKLTSESLVFAIISNPSQVIAARGNLLWQAVFPNESEVPWERVGGLLRDLFWTQTGRSLDDNHLNYLARRLFSHQRKTTDFNAKDFPKEMVSYDLFVKKQMWERKKSFSFWKWISCCMNTVAKEKGPAHKDWTKTGVIQGFMAREDVANLLSHSTPGTVIIRFSESTIDNDSGGAHPFAALNVGIKYVNPEKGIDDVYFTMEALNPRESDNYKLKRGLGSVLRSYTAKGDQNRLITYIYPNLSIDDAFEDCTQSACSYSTSGPYAHGCHAIHLNPGEGHFAILGRRGPDSVPQPSPPHSEYMQSPEPTFVNSPNSQSLLQDNDIPWPVNFDTVPMSMSADHQSDSNMEMITLQNLITNMPADMQQ